MLCSASKSLPWRNANFATPGLLQQPCRSITRLLLEGRTPSTCWLRGTAVWVTAALDRSHCLFLGSDDDAIASGGKCGKKPLLSRHFDGRSLLKTKRWCLIAFQNDQSSPIHQDRWNPSSHLAPFLTLRKGTLRPCAILIPERLLLKSLRVGFGVSKRYRKASCGLAGLQV